MGLVADRLDDGARRARLNVRLVHRQAARQRVVNRRDPARPVLEDGLMKKRILITGLILAALLLALYGVVFGTGAD
jgi:hypothetical protein